jgi:glycine oxidase
VKVGIAGAGLLGRLLAWRLSGLGHAVTVFDPAVDALDRGRAAGWTAAGMLSPLAELEGADARVAELGLRSLPLWADIVGQLPDPVHFRREGSLLLAHRNDLGMARRLLDVIRAKLPGSIGPLALSNEQLRELEPDVHGPAHAWLLEGEGQIHAVQAMQALAADGVRRHVCWRWAQEMRSLAPGRIESDRFDAVFDVRGVGARSTTSEENDIPSSVRGVRGEIVWLHAPGVSLRRPMRLLHPRWRVYLVPRPGDIVVVGASEIESEDRSPISVRTLLGLLSAAHSVVPELAEARLVHTETNLRPALPDNLPRIEHRPGLTRINGLFRHGWLIAPALVEDALAQAGLQTRHEAGPAATTVARHE